MATSYPGGIDSFVNPSPSDPLSNPAHAGQHSDANDAIEAIETTLGASVQGSFVSVRARLDDMTASINTASVFAAAAAVSASQAADSALLAGDYAASTLSLYTAFDARYLGAKSASPAVDNTGAPLIVGALYFDTVDNDMKEYTSASVWQSVSASAVSAYVATAALYDQFDDRYLGAKASDPSTDNDGNTLLVGALYFNTVLNVMKVWTGTAWVNAVDTPYNWTGPIAISASSASPALFITQLGTGDVLRLADEAGDTSIMTIDATGALLTFSTVTASAPGRFQGHGAVTQCTSTTRPSSPQEGDVIYETDTDQFFGWNGTEWSSIGGGSIAYQTTPPTTNLSDGTLWVDSDGSASLINANDYYTKPQVDALIANTGGGGYPDLFLLGGM